MAKIKRSAQQKNKYRAVAGLCGAASAVFLVALGQQHAVAQHARGVKLSAPSSADLGANAMNHIEDVQIGERNGQARIALICARPCALEKSAGGAYIMPGVDASLAFDFKDHSQYLASLTAISAPRGSLLRITTAVPFSKADEKACQVAGRSATCIDFYFDQPLEKTTTAKAPHVSQKRAAQNPARKIVKAPSAAKAAPTAHAAVQAVPQAIATLAPRIKPSGTNQQRVAAAAPALRGNGDAAASVPILGGLTISKPALRDIPTTSYAPTSANSAAAKPILAKIAPAPSAPAMREDNSGNLVAKIAPAPVTRAQAAPQSSSAFSSASAGKTIAAHARQILGKELSAIDCAHAQTILQADAWALDAMADVGFCHAIAGELEKADGVFARLLQYMPKNYEAAIGRALIAAQVNEKSIARKYFKDALSSNPPTELSGRINAAMMAMTAL